MLASLLASRTDECQTGSFRGGEVAAGWHQGGTRVGAASPPGSGQQSSKLPGGGPEAKLQGTLGGQKKGKKGKKRATRRRGCCFKL